MTSDVSTRPTGRRSPARTGAPPLGAGDPRRLDRTLADTDALLGEVCDRLVEDWTARSPEPADVITPDLPELLRDWLLPATGKRLRPVMCHWGWVAARGPERSGRAGRDELVALCAALELVHLFALVHDDVMDRSDSRRGRPTTHVEAARAHVRADALGDPELFGDSVAILYGDLALTEAWHLAASCSPPLRRAWADMLRELVQGQLLDVTGAAARRRDLERARLVAMLKSGAYTVQRPLRLGALAAGADDGATTAASPEPAPPGALEALDDYGRHVGEAFALRDDILGIWGDPARTGKPVGDDLLSGKPTVLLAEAQRALPADLVARHLGPHATVTPDAVPLLQEAMREAGVLERTERRIAAEVDLACAALARADLDPGAVDELVALARAIGWRDS
ncbi:polyprenyl synthetase family protein [Terrabacter sp. NPDC000476]|uniref:polyprenyl synthetase family protein n=1 Tax=Terrabacter sp. NPDC000476 TaxID=3154258 RepID=UPI0033313D32